MFRLCRRSVSALLSTVVMCSAVPVALVLLALGAPFPAQAQTMSPPAEALTGDKLAVPWSGDYQPRDYITIVKPDAGDAHYESWGYLSSANPIMLQLPMEPGTYEVRLNRESEGTVIQRSTIELKVPKVTIRAPATAPMGSVIEVHWDGPDLHNDYITVVTPDTPDRQWDKYTYTHTGNPLKLTVPDTPGTYELRYCNGAHYNTLATATLEVTAASASLEAPAEVTVGTQFDVRFDGPRNQGDYITIVTPDTADNEWGAYRYVSEEGSVSMTAPGEPGTYELRYASGQSYRALAKRTFEVVDATASVSAKAEVEADQPFEVTWEGPGGPRDWVGLHRLTDDGEDPYVAWQYVKHANPLRLQAPLLPGAYEVRYHLGGTDRVLASQALTIVGSTQPGRLHVTAGTSTAAAGPSAAVVVILDASGSMLQREGGKRRIEIAREALSGLIDQLPAATPFALRVFGHREANSCRTDLEIPLAPLDKAAASSKVASIQAMNLAKTPIGRSLDLTRQDTQGHPGETLVILLTDGEETCDGDPRAAIEALNAAGQTVRVNIVGLAIDSVELQETFREWARLGSGRFFGVHEAEALQQTLVQALQTPFELTTADGRVVMTGDVGGDPVEVPAGTYTVRTGGQEYDVTVRPGDLTTLEL